METSLYLPVKSFLEGLGYTVQGEVGHCDLVALGFLAAAGFRVAHALEQTE